MRTGQGRHDRGFTLVEIVVAIVLVGMLSAIVVVGVGRLADDAGRAACRSSADAAAAAATAHWATTGRQAGTFADLVSSGSMTPPDGAVITGRILSTAEWTVRMSNSNGAAPTFSCSTATEDAAAQRFWVGAASTSWSDPANWSTISGGSGGAAVPGPSDAVVLDGGATRDLVVDGSVDVIVRSWMQTAAFTRTVTFATRYAGPFDTFTVTDSVQIDGGIWTHQANASTQTFRLAVDVGGDVSLGVGGRIDVVGRGFSEGAGPGGSTLTYQGASHGGTGIGAGAGGLGASPATYGSFVQPVDLGSGGGPPRTGASRGGGAVRLTVAGAARVDGTVTAAGACASEYAGCAAGGSIWISTGTMMGSGTINADGGATSWTAPSGGGGRIAVDLSTGTDVGGVILRARGGPPVPRASIPMAAGPGTVYVERAGDPDGNGQLILDNGDQPVAGPTRTSVPNGSTWTVGQLVLRGGAQLSVGPGSTLDLTAATITGGPGTQRSGIRTAGGTLRTPASFTISGWSLMLDTPLAATGTWTVTSNGGITQNRSTSTNIVRSSLDLTGDLIVAAGGSIDVSATGYPAFTGPGSQIGNNQRFVGSHGGRASTNGVTYGDAVAPVEPGSGSHAFAGGGAIALRVSGRLQVDGGIRGDGGGCGWNCGGGAAGGSIWITAGTVVGAGTISADGGADGWMGGGGGGRVSITVTASGATIDPALVIRALGGSGPGSGAPGRVGAGSLYLKTPADAGVLILDVGTR